MQAYKQSEETKRENLNKYIQEQRKLIQEKEQLIKAKNEKIQKVIHNIIIIGLDGRRV